jgi:two-component system, response regulator PdtaR
VTVHNSGPFNSGPNNSGPDSSEPAATEPIRIVVAEDEAIIRLDLTEMLAEEGYVVVAETGRGDEVLDLVTAVEPDLAILDIKMPGLDGLSAARAIAEQRTCAVIILTAFSQRDLIAEARDAGVLAYLVKPFQKPELVAAVEVAVGRFRELRALGSEVDRLTERIEARRLIDRAKSILIASGMTELDAHANLQRQAMDQRTSMQAVAQRIIDQA